MKDSGGDLEFTSEPYVPYHNRALKLYTVRNSFEYILLAKKFIPHYTSEVMLDLNTNYFGIKQTIFL
jgi:hypothetical protein